MQIMRDFPGRDVRSNSLFNSFFGLFEQWLYRTPPDGYKKDIKILDIKIFIYKDIQYYFFCMEIFVSTWNYNTNRNNI